MRAGRPGLHAQVRDASTCAHLGRKLKCNRATASLPSCRRGVATGARPAWGCADYVCHLAFSRASSMVSTEVPLVNAAGYLPPGAPAHSPTSRQRASADGSVRAHAPSHHHALTIYRSPPIQDASPRILLGQGPNLAGACRCQDLCKEPHLILRESWTAGTGGAVCSRR